MESKVERKIYLDVGAVIKSSQKPAVLAVAEAGAGEAVKLAPVKDGLLRISIQAESISDTRAKYGSNLEYAAYQEFGTKKMNAQPYLRPAADWVKKNGGKAYIAVLKGALKRG